MLGGKNTLESLSVLEPACNRGDMASVLAEYFGTVEASDVHDYGYGKVKNFLDGHWAAQSHDWVITNPPFRLAEQFVHQARRKSRYGVAVLTRTVFIESIGRFERLFSENPPTIVAQYTERVPMVKGRLDEKASTATGYCWLVWTTIPKYETSLKWIPPCRKLFERSQDYANYSDQAFLRFEKDGG